MMITSNAAEFCPMGGICRGIVLVVAILLTPVLSALAQAPESFAVVKALESLEKALEKEQALSPDTLEALRAVVRALREERAQPPEINKGKIAKVVDEYLTASPPSLPETPLDEFLERFTLYGDLRLRHESDFELDTRPERNRERVRARLGVNYELTDTLVMGARLVTGNSDDPNSSHQTLGRVFDSFETSLDRLFLTYRPGWFEKGWLSVGKFSHPFYVNPVYGELVWDSDVQPEGISVAYGIRDVGRFEQLDLVAGQYILLEQGRAEEAYVTAVQASGRLRLTDDLRATVALGYYMYSDVSPDGTPIILLGDDAGNALIDRDFDGVFDDFESDFGIVNPILAITYDGWRWPFTVSGEYIRNIRANIQDDEGWALGWALGSTKKKRDWQLYYQWQIVAQDAVFSPVAQDDFLFATNHRSHLLGIKYQFTDKVQAHLWSLVSRRDRRMHFLTGGTDQDQWRLRLDLNLKF